MTYPFFFLLPVTMVMSSCHGLKRPSMSRYDILILSFITTNNGDE